MNTVMEQELHWISGRKVPKFSRKYTDYTAKYGAA